MMLCRKGMDLYFKRHDGQAVTCDDFRNAMADANDKDLSSFAAWYAICPQAACILWQIPTCKLSVLRYPLWCNASCLEFSTGTGDSQSPA